MRRWAKRIGWALAALLLLAGAALLGLDTGIGHRWIADRLAAIRTDNGLRFAVGRIDGSIYGAASLSNVRVYDPEGLVAVAPSAALDWRPLAWLDNRLDIRSLRIPRLDVVKPLHTRPTHRQGPILPGFDIRIGRLAIDRIGIAPALTGVARTGRLSATVDLHRRRALVRLDAVVDGSDRLHARIDAAPDADRFDVAARARGAAAGVLSQLSGLGRPIALDVAGQGRWAEWYGNARLDVGTVPAARLALANRAGAYSLSGALVIAPLTHGKLKSLSAPRVLVSGAATLAHRQLEGALNLRSPQIDVSATGGLDLAAVAYRNVRVRARLLHAPAAFPNMTAHDFEVRAIFEGAFATARFDYRIDSDRFAFDDTGFENVHAAGRGHLSHAPVAIPIRLVADRITGVGEVAGGILRHLTAEGVLRVTPHLLTGDALRVRSDKLTGSINLFVSLDDGNFHVDVNGALGRYLIPGLGLVDVRSLLRVVPGPGGHGTRVLGQGAAKMVRLDNAFFRSLAGGLFGLTADLERTPDFVLHFHHLVLTGPTIRLAGEGYRRRDGSFHFEGGGTQGTYGPLTLLLDGQIDKPTLDIVFTNPNEALGLRATHLHLDPNTAGFAFTIAGRSRLGPYSGAGQIALPPGGQGAIEVARLDVSGTRASGRLAIVDDGFDGRLQLAGGGLTGEVIVKPQGTIQRIDTHLDANGARLSDEAVLRHGHLDLSVLLDPAGTRVEATASGTGLRRGALVLGRFAAHAELTGGSGTLRAAIAGTQGRAFEIQTVTQIAPGRYTLAAQGTLDKRPLQLLTPAVFEAEGDGYRLGKTRLSFAGGEAEVSGQFTAQSSEIDASLTAMPLAILDIGYPGLGLGGAASGTFSFGAVRGAAPTGRMNITVRGLTRSGLVTTSAPIDLGIAAVLDAQKLGVRALMASGGKTIGRGQALLTPLAGDDLATRLNGAPLIAQLRYGGPADTLWRLTGVELFDLSGPVAIAADVGGRLADPVIRGVVQANGARLESATTGTVLTNVQASGSFGGAKLQIDRLTADAGKGGHVTGTGSFDFSSTRGVGIDVKLQAEHAVLINRDDIGATVTGPVSFRSSGRGGTIAGDVLLDRSRYRLGQATAATAAPQLAVKEINLPGGDEEEDVPTQPWTLDLHARAKNALTVSGLGLSSEWSADLQIGGDPENPRITGRADLVRGDVEFSGREFQLSRGILRFTGEVPANPALDISADATAQDLTATIRVTGTAVKPEISFISVPALPEDELLSRLLFGTSITNLSAPEALQLASAVSGLQSGKGGLDPINAIRRVAGLDRLRILPADPTTGQKTAVAAGKYVTRRLYAEIVTDGQGYSATQVEFQVTRWLALLSSISTLGRTSGNVRVSKDF